VPISLKTPLAPHGARPIIDPGIVSPALAERLLTEGLISLVQAAAMLPPVRGKRVSTSSIFRWIVKGKHGVKLEAIKMGGTAYWTSKQAMARFASALTFQAQPR
jgi:hypothetical protein